jgi:hypothetical protein
MDATGMAVLIGVLAVIMVAAFLVVWLRDRNRSQDVTDDAERLDTDPSGRNRATGH